MSRKLVIPFLFVLLSCLLYVRFDRVEVKALNGYPVHNLDTGLDYITIQEAIDAPETLNGHTISVETGTYYEHIIIKKEGLSIIGEDPYTTIIDGNGTGTGIAIIRRKATVSGFTIQNCRFGFELGPGGSLSRDNIRISNSIVTNNRIGCDGYVYDSMIANNIFSNNDVCGLRISGTNNTFSYNRILNNSEYGVELIGAENSNVTGNLISENDAGIRVWNSDGTIISNNTVISNKDVGVSLDYSGNTVLTNNNMTNNHYNLDVSEKYLQNIDTTNTVDGKPVYYWINQKDKQVPFDAGYVVVINSINITVKDLTLERNGQGILFINTNDSVIMNVNASNNMAGIILCSCSNNTIVDNFVSNNHYGISLNSAKNNTVSNNIVAENDQYGLHLLESWNNSVITNDILNNVRGIFLTDSANNTVRTNEMSGSLRNFDVEGISLEDFINYIDTSNTVNGKPVYYWLSQTDKQIPFDAGYVAVINSTNILVKDVIIANNGNGALFAYTTNSIVENTRISNCSYGVFMYQSNSNRVSKNELLDNEYAIIVDGLDNVVENNLISSNKWFDGTECYKTLFGQLGIVLDGYNNTAKTNILVNNEYGILMYSSNNTASFNILTNNLCCIYMPCSYPQDKIHNNTIDNNIATNSTYGIFLGQSGGIPEAIGPSNNIISNNIVIDNEYGIQVDWSSTHDNFLCNNIVANNTHGFYLGGSNNVLRNNIIINNKCNFQVMYSFYHDIDTSNTVNGKPIYYLVKRSNIIVDPSTSPNIGYLGIVDSTNILVQDLNLERNGQGLLLVGLTNSTIKNVNTSNNIEGIYLDRSANNTLMDNIIENNSEYGICLESSQHNIFQGNSLSSNAEAFYLYASDSNIIRTNIISNNSGGIYMDYSKENIIYHNNFINNTWQAKNHPIENWWILSINKWDNDMEGNYWSDYNGTDFSYGPYQNITGSDGIGDKSYFIDAYNIDHYPLMGIFSDFPVDWANRTYHLAIISNSTISDFQFGVIVVYPDHAVRPPWTTSIIFNATGDTPGFFRIMIPKDVLDGEYVVSFDDFSMPPSMWKELPVSNETTLYLYLTYLSGSHKIWIMGTTAIPELQSFFVLPLFIIATLIAVVVYKTKSYTKHNLRQ